MVVVVRTAIQVISTIMPAYRLRAQLVSLLCHSVLILIGDRLLRLTPSRAVDRAMRSDAGEDNSELAEKCRDLDDHTGHH